MQEQPGAAARESFQVFIAYLFAGYLLEAESLKLYLGTFWNNHRPYHHLSQTEGILPSRESILSSKLKIYIFRDSEPEGASAAARLNSQVAGPVGCLVMSSLFAVTITRRLIESAKNFLYQGMATLVLL